MIGLAVPVALLFLAGAAHADDLAVTVRDRAGVPVQNAVVTFKPTDRAQAGAIRFAWPMRMSQRDITFEPHVLIAPVGADVAFPNFDSVRHHVYSFSNGNKFELRLFGREETRSYRFMTPGVAAIGCNIHDRMSAFIVVVDTPYAAKTGADGRAVLKDAAGGGALAIWHQDLRAPSNRVIRQIGAARASDEIVVVDLRAPARPHH